MVAAQPPWLHCSWPWGNASPDFSTALHFCKSEFLHAVLCHPRAAMVQPVLRKVLLSPVVPTPAAPRVTILTASSHECPWAESDLDSKCLWRAGIPEKGPSLCLALLLSGIYSWTDYKHWRQLLPRLKIALEEGLTFPWPAASCNCYS